MGVSWTEQQLSVIEHRKQNLLVSAAAGSGKTAVLVERILSRILDPKDPVDIDELLIVTFTRAAAGEMRERIGIALARALEEDPSNVHLQRQQTLLHHAQINTIHGFCAYVIQNYFPLIGLDPSYRMGDEGEMKLMKQDVAARVLEQAYAQADPDFLQFVECFATGKNDDGLEGLLLRLYESAESNPWPDQYYDSCLSVYRMNLEELYGSSFWKEMTEEVDRLLQDAERGAKENVKATEQEDGPYWYRAACESDLSQVQALRETTSYEERRMLLSGLAFARLGAAPRKRSASEYLIEQVKKRRESYKKQLKTLKDSFFLLAEADIVPTLQVCRVPVEQLVAITRVFGEAYSREKRKKNILDFSDLEHFALQILARKAEDGSAQPTEAALEIASHFREIMIDEYQDSNLIQEVLLSCVSGHGEAEHNRFMVGDIKQSIYGFRLARPELFLEKYHTYRQEPEEGHRIDLAKNFRSRTEVLDSVNYFFRQLMCESLGGIAYDQDAALYPGADYPENPEQGANKTELLLVRNDDLATEQEETGQGAPADTEQPGRTNVEAECYVIADRIRSIVGQMDIMDKATGGFRKAGYGDIVILLRTVSGWSETFLQVLKSLDIPAYAATRTGYFSATEVVTVLNYLRICDNPLQDIPLAAVLYSPIGNFSEAELTRIRVRTPEGSLYEALASCAEGEQDALARKSAAFLSQLDGFRARVPYTPIHRLLGQVLDETGYLCFASAMPSGNQRKANLEMLIQKATEYESTSFHGLFHFVRYIEQLHEYEVDFGEVNINGENTDAVRIMSIHKSKGLEFPIVFVAGLGKKFNLADARGSLTMHAGLGIGAQHIDPNLRIKENTLISKIIQRTIVRETLAEELRVLYVALTRAREKLILTGCIGDPEKMLMKCSAITSFQEEVLPYAELIGAATYLDWVLMALARSDAFLPLYKEIGFFPDRRPGELKAPSLPLQIRITSPRNLVEEEVLRQIRLADQKRELLMAVQGEAGDPAFAEEISRRFGFCYPFEQLMHMPVKVSVSDLKKKGMEESEEGVPMFSHAEAEKIIPAFARDASEGSLAGAQRGTAFHRLLQELAFARAHTEKEVQAQIDKLVREAKMDREQGSCIDLAAITALVNSPIGQRMEACQKAGSFHAEQPFVMAVSAALADAAWPEEEEVLVQGIIDVWMEEADGLVLLDYKTDRVTPRSKGILVSRYQTQLFYYKMALERLTGKPVKEVHIYSLTIDEDIELKI